jgi:hypothetical protein
LSVARSDDGECHGDMSRYFLLLLLEWKVYSL